MSETQFYSYMWLREDRTPYYVGKGTGKRAFVRGSHHLRPPKDQSKIVVFPMLNETEAIESEKALIDMFGRIDIGSGWAEIAPCLRNFTNGGDGVSGLRHTEESKRRMGDARRGKPGTPLTPEHIAAMAAGRKGKKRGPRSEETKLKISKSNKGKQNCLGHVTSEETKRKISQAHLGKKHSPETLAKLRESHLGRKPSAESRQKLSESIKLSWILRRKQGKTNRGGHKHSEGSKQKMRVAAFTREAKKREWS